MMHGQKNIKLSPYMFRAIMLIFRRSHYCIHAACGIITL